MLVAGLDLKRETALSAFEATWHLLSDACMSGPKAYSMKTTLIRMDALERFSALLCPSLVEGEDAEAPLGE